MRMNARNAAAFLCASLLLAVFISSGCSTMKQPSWMRKLTTKTKGSSLADSEDLYLTPEERAKRLAKAKTQYLAGDRAFRTATSKKGKEGRKDYLAAAKSFEKAVKAHPGSAIAQDAQYMAAESYFFADYLTKAEKAYGILQKKFPNSRHNDRAAARQFAIAQYWVETEKAGGSFLPFNLVDRKRPFFDIDGHAIRVLDQIRFDDPTGKLADDATMAAAMEHLRQKNYLEADEFFTDLRETFTDSEHLFNAHLLGIRCKMDLYAGPKYSRLVLDEAETLIAQTRKRFPDRLKDPEVRDVIARASAEVSYRQAERLAVRADYREKRSEYGAARQYYQELLAEHDDTPYAKTARDRLAVISDYPEIPPQRLAWLIKVFPPGKRAKPLVTSESTTFFR